MIEKMKSGRWQLGLQCLHKGVAGRLGNAQLHLQAGDFLLGSADVADLGLGLLAQAVDGVLLAVEFEHGRIVIGHTGLLKKH